MCKSSVLLPTAAAQLIERLVRAGFEAYAVGGCIRDTLLGRPPNDWDICTAAVPAETAACFRGFRVVATGARHGTVTVLVEGVPYEVTTYRVDGAYTDARRPDEVRFVKSLREDAARRDFTINAMAAGLSGQVEDFWGGREDLAAGLIRCVGDPDRRFQEDALRLLRALRFASVFGFSIERCTADALSRNRALLGLIAGERVSAELRKLLLGPAAGRVLAAYSDVLAVVLPEIGPGGLFCAAQAVAMAERSLTVRLAALLGPIGPEAAGGVLRRLRFDGATIRRVEELARWRGARLTPEDGILLRWLGRLGTAQMQRLLALQRAELLAGTKAAGADLRRLCETQTCLAALLEAGTCFHLRDLSVNGGDLIAAGVPAGREVGETLRRLLALVMDGAVQNRRDCLLDTISFPD